MSIQYGTIHLASDRDEAFAMIINAAQNADQTLQYNR